MVVANVFGECAFLSESRRKPFDLLDNQYHPIDHERLQGYFRKKCSGSTGVFLIRRE
jgi:hypothetical protein